MKILILDNYDSFTYNLVYIVRELGFKPDIFRNDKIALEKVNHYDKILLSPGPGIPSEAGIMPQLIGEFAASKSIFGVCLGHQSIGESFGGTLINLSEVYHGVATEVTVLDSTEVLFKNLPTIFKAGRYHSWAIANSNLPPDLETTAIDAEGAIMAIRHRKYDVRGVQFHPESVMTEHGKKMLSNWLVD